AQVPDAGAIREQQRDVQEFYQLQKRLQEAAPPADVIDDDAVRAKPATPPAGATAQVRVNRFRVNDSGVLARPKIDAVLAEYTGRELSIAQLFEAVAAVNRLYRDAGCVTCQAFLPPQKVEGGEVEIRLVEGRLGEVRVEGAKYLRESFLLDRISMRKGQLFDAQGLERDLARFNATVDARALARLRPGAKYGEVDAIVQVAEPPRFGLGFFADNAGRDDVGRNRTGFLFNARSVFGNADPLVITGVVAQGTQSASLAYNTPVNRWGTRVGLLADASAINVIDGPFATLDVTGGATTTGLTLQQPVVATNRWRANLNLGFITRDSVSRFGGATVSRVDTRVWQIGAEALRFTGGGFVSTRHTLGVGTRDMGGDADFLKLTGDATWSHGFDNGISTLLRGAYQLSNTQPLPAFEQFFVGGAATVRGFYEGQRAGERGYFVSAEVGFPIRAPGATAERGPGPDRLRGFFFVDHGAAFPNKPAGIARSWDDYLTSTGIGVSIAPTSWMTGRLSLGVPVAERSPNPRGWVLHGFIQIAAF
ncbi:MAG: BamA/TamA family outer membrane protein, partial [Burkholderiales bacterium]|nr:BamA/TamA family outer membrane protein [Burkholderiales bacterium]